MHKTLTFLLLLAATACAQPLSPNGVKTMQGPIKTSVGWSLGVRAGDFVFVAGMQGVDPQTQQLVAGARPRIRQAFLNMQKLAESEGATLRDCVRLHVFVSDLQRYAPIVNEVMEELWGAGPYPPRTLVEVQRLYDDDIAEIEGTFYAPQK